jgi:YHS domain-containing protein
MKANGGKKVAKKPAKKKGKLEEWFINILAIVLLGGGLVVIVYMTTQMSGEHSKDTDQYLASLPSQSDTISHSKICMVDDIYQGDYPTLSVRLSANTYYGCDAKAIHELSSKQNLRFAIDPVTKRKVNKGSAVVGLHSKRDGKVLYFESNETFNQYLKTLDQ